MRVSRIIWIASAAALCAGAASAAPLPTWIEAPTYAQAAAVYPDKDKAHPIAGTATLTCTITYSGRLSDCETLREGPTGHGFDEAAHKLAAYMRLQTGPGMSSGDEVRVTFGFLPEMASGAAALESNPVWVEIPPITDFQATFPKTANGVNHVVVVLACDVEAGGALSGCKVDSEDPAGQGYGQAALTLGPKFRVGLMTGDGLPTVGAKVRVPIRYELTPVPPPKS